MQDLRKFTNEKYSTKQDVMDALNLRMVDALWSQILSYRSDFSTSLPLKTIDGDDLSVCFCPYIIKKISDVSRKFSKFSIQYIKSSNSLGKNEFKDDILTLNLELIAKYLRVDVSKEQLKRIVTNQQTSIDPSCIVLQDYSNLTNELLSQSSLRNYDGFVDYLYYVTTRFNPDSSRNNSIFKTQPHINSNTDANGIYYESPVSMTTSLMEDLTNFIQSENDEFDDIVKIAVLAFYVQYLKPFERYSEEILFLLLKYMCLNSDMDYPAVLLCFERLLEDADKQQQIINEVQKTIDFTYYLDYFLNFLDRELQYLIDLFVVQEAKTIKKEYYQADSTDSKTDDEYVDTDVNIESLLERGNAFGAPNQDNSNLINNTDNGPIKYKQEVAVTNVTLGLNNDDAQLVEQHLMETNPNLSQAQAYFYARHCTLGNVYTIATYKKFIGCAYETARSSMDKLVAEGYYSKEPFKNKFIYRPIKRK